MQFERQILGDHDLRVARVQRGDRPTVVMTNAFPQSIRCWESLWDRMAEHFNLLAVDLAGFGMSGGPVVGPAAQADLLVSLMDADGIDRAFVVGPDIGVPVALSLAVNHPERLFGVNVFDGPGTWPADFARPLEAAVRRGIVRWLGSGPPLRGWLMKQNFEAATAGSYHHFRPSEAAIEEYRGICFDAQKNRDSLAYLGSYRHELPRVEERLPSVSVPVLITWGAGDWFVPPSNAERLHALLPNSELTIFEEAWHFSHEDADERWLQRFIAFVESHQPQPEQTLRRDA